MSWTLYKKELKSNYKILIIFLAVISLYSGLIIAMYDPNLNSSLYVLAESMPQIFAAFNMTNIATTLIDFITNYLYGFILIVFPFLFCVILCHRLLSRYIDKGSMAYLLATHQSRLKIVMTQLVVLLTGILILVAYTTVFILFISHMMFEEVIPLGEFLMVNVGLFGLIFFLGSLCYLGGCCFNETKLSITFGAGLGILFILIQMIGQVGDKFEFLKYMTPLTLFHPQAITSGESEAFIGILALYLISIIIVIVGMMIFKKRDLPL